MSTPYAYECRDHGDFLDDFEFGNAPSETPCPECSLPSLRIYTSASIQFTYGKDDWHGPTLGERLAQQKQDFPTAEPVGDRWI